MTHGSHSRRSPRLPPSLKAAGPGAQRREKGAGGIGFLLLVLATLACNRLFPGGTSTPGLRDPAEPLAAYMGQFDCYGSENGLQVYAGRVTVKPGGEVTFKNYDGIVQTGAWTYDLPGKTFTFTGRTDLASAIYRDAEDSLVVVLVPGAAVAHADIGMRCQRAVPGQTGPP
jgi:hypothetical protein